jgi:mannose-6-phosphate isomerase
MARRVDKPWGHEIIWAEGEMGVRELAPGEHEHVPAGTVHRFEAATARVELVEVSTPEIDDVVRLDDDFGRQGTAAP